MNLNICGVARKVLLIFVILVIFFIPVMSAITVTPDTTFVIENRTFTFSHTMNFHTITVGDSYIIFNSS
jgi:hypothetical protein